MIDSSQRPSPEQISEDIQSLYGSFELDPLGQVGISDSAHGVVFGTIEGVGDVGVKPFTKLGKAKRELSTYERLEDLGFETIEPLEAIRCEAASYLISIRRRGLRNLAQEPWRESTESEIKLARTLAALGSVAIDTASLHGSGVTHGDYQVKNVSYDTRSGLFVVTDVERMQIGRAGEYQRVGATEDMGRLGTSLIKKGVFDGKTTQGRIRMLDEALLEPYMESAGDRTSRADGSEVLRQWRLAATTGQ